MKMVKASEKDIDAAGQAMAVLNNISSGYYPSCAGDGDEDAPTFFDPDDPKHLRLFYDLMNQTLDDAPGWPSRVIGGMCYVILFDKNQIVDPDADCLELHPRFAATLADAKRYRWLRDLGIDYKPANYDGRPVGRFDFVLDNPDNNLDAVVDAEIAKAEGSAA